MSQGKKIKSYRIKAHIKLLFQAIDSVIGTNKNNLLYSIAYNQNLPDYPFIRKLPSLDKSDLFITIVESFKEEQLQEFGFDLDYHERIIGLTNIVVDKKLLDIKMRTLINVRINEDIAQSINQKKKKEITKIKKEKIYVSETLEIIILFYVIQLDERIYHLVKDVYEYILKNEDYQKLLDD